MRATLEKTDLLKILSKEFGYELKEEDVKVHADPFEVEVRNLPIHDLQAPASDPIPKTTVVEDTGTKPELTETTSDVLTVGQLLNPNPPMGDIMAANASLMQSKESRQPTPDNEFLTRPLGPDESDNPPPIGPGEGIGGLDAVKRLAGEF